MPWAGSRSILKAVESFAPDLLVCADDQAVRDLHRIYADKFKTGNHAAAMSICKLIVRSLGQPASYAFAVANSDFIKFARSTGVRCPHTAIIPNERFLKSISIDVAHPTMLKADRAFGGAGVRFADNIDMARRSFRQLVNGQRWPTAFLEIVRGLTPKPLLDRLLKANTHSGSPGVYSGT